MLPAERKKIILERLKTQGSVLVTSLGVEFAVSEETIRRDLEKLESEGYAIRGYGGAVYNEEGRAELPYSVRKRTNVEGKRRIAVQVARLIDDGDFIMLDESSTSTFIAREIKEKKGITLITNSIEIISELSPVSGWTVLCTGGMLKQDILSLTGSQAENFIRLYHVDKAVISCTGLDINAGFSDAGEDNAFIKRAMMDAANKTILACDGHKFGRRAFAHVGMLSSLTALVTDREPDDLWKAALEENGVDLYYE